MNTDEDLEILLDLDGCRYDYRNGFWIKIEAHRVNPSGHIPHGIRYSLTLHDRNNTRIAGYDNAHGVKPPKRKRYGARKIVAWDHRHEYSREYPYEFDTAAGLLSDFWNDVERIMGEI